MQATGVLSSEEQEYYTTVEDREMAAYRESTAHAHEVGEWLMDDELVAELTEMKDEL